MSWGTCVAGCRSTYMATVDGLSQGLLAALDNPNLTQAQRDALMAQWRAECSAAEDALVDCITACYSSQGPPQGPQG